MSWSAVINKPKLQRDLMHENKSETYESNGMQQIPVTSPGSLENQNNVGEKKNKDEGFYFLI